MKSPSRRLARLYLAGSFLAGSIAGGAVGFALAWVPPPATPQRMAEHIQRRLASELRLTEDQTRQIAPIASELVNQMDQEHERFVECMVQIIHQSHQRMEQYLTAEQVEKLRRIRQEREEAFRRAARPPR